MQVCQHCNHLDGSHHKMMLSFGMIPQRATQSPSYYVALTESGARIRTSSKPLNYNSTYNAPRIRAVEESVRYCFQAVYTTYTSNELRRRSGWSTRAHGTRTSQNSRPHSYFGYDGTVSRQLGQEIISSIF